MSSFIVTPYRMRKPSTQVSRSMRGRQAITPTLTPQTPPQVIQSDDIAELQNVVSSLTLEIESVKSSMLPLNQRLLDIEEQASHTLSGMDNLRTELAPEVGVSKRLQEIEEQARHTLSGMDNLRSELAPEVGVSKRLQTVEDTTTQLSKTLDTMRGELAPEVGVSKRLQTVEDTTTQLSKKLDTMRSELAPERGVSKRVSSMEAKLSYTTNRFETYKDEHEKAHTIVNDKLMEIDDRIACHPSLKILSSRMDTIEASIDRLMSTLSGLSQAPVIQKRVTGSRPVDDESIQFGTIHRITPQ